MTALAATEPARLALVNMPFASTDMPSIQCGLLKAVLEQEGHRVDIHYLNLELSAKLGPEDYDELAHLPKNLLLGEWLFSVAAFGPRGGEGGYRAAFPGLEKVLGRLDLDFDDLCELRKNTLPRWIDGWSQAVDWGRYRMVGFTSMFEQNAAALALARRVKARHPQTAIVFGGANFDGEMGREYLRTQSFIDFVVSGEGDVALPRLVERLLRGTDPLDVPGVLGRSPDGVSRTSERQSLQCLDRLPDPDYGEYFSTLERLGRERAVPSGAMSLPLETSRGCWWGQKRHCTFCGLNRSGIGFRSKSVEAVLGQLQRLSERYRVTNFQAVDNILDHRYVEALCSVLARERYDYRFFFEVKANLKPAQIGALKRAGVAMVQPGIESLSSELLTLMGKGVSALQNVRFLKWAHYHRLKVMWNVLAGFPGERPEHYEEQRRLVPLLRHLPPPEGYGPIWLQRFSPYFSESCYPVRNVRPFAAYQHVYPPDLDLQEIAYFFECEMGSTLEPAGYEPLFGALGDWQEAWRGDGPRPALVYQRAPDWIQVVDRRGEEPEVHALGGPEAALFEGCSEGPVTVPRLARQLRAQGMKMPEPEIRNHLEQFCEKGLAIEEKGRYLSLALPVNRHL